MSGRKHYEISFPVNWEIQLEFINVAHDNARVGTHTQILYTHTAELPHWHFINSLQMCRLSPWSRAARQNLKLQGAPELATSSGEHTHPHIKHAVQIFSVCATMMWKRLEAVATSKKKKKDQNNLRSHFKVAVTKRKLVRTWYHWERKQ